MIIIIQTHQFRQGRDLIEMIQCQVEQNGVSKKVWLATWEVAVDMDVELNDEQGNKSFWKITKVLTPDG